jgi:hypothetical protein
MLSECHSEREPAEAWPRAAADPARRGAPRSRGSSRRAGPPNLFSATMHPAAAAFVSMPPEQQRGVHLRLLHHALRVWEQHYPPGGRPTYRESVAGTLQELDVELPRQALAAIHDRRDPADIAARYREPITALRDADLTLSPEAAEFAYYAIYNAFRLHALGHSTDPWLVVNQALSTVESEQVVATLQEAVDNSG